MKLSRHFDRKEFACKCGCGFDTVDVELIRILEHVRYSFGSPVTINSACRCEAHNKAVGGSVGSKHLRGIAADIVVKDVEASKVYKFLDHLYSDRYGLGSYDSFCHIDVRSKRARW